LNWNGEPWQGKIKIEAGKGRREQLFVGNNEDFAQGLVTYIVSQVSLPCGCADFARCRGVWHTRGELQQMFGKFSHFVKVDSQALVEEFR
jgi:hypothetical protein